MYWNCFWCLLLVIIGAIIIPVLNGADLIGAVHGNVGI